MYVHDYRMLEKLAIMFPLSCVLQKELRQLKTKPQFDQLIKHCQQNCEGTSLTTLLNMPTERVSETYRLGLGLGLCRARARAM